jgi:quercetin dioxygenase-like cupin family protein
VLKPSLAGVLIAVLLSSGGAAQKPASTSPGDALFASPVNFKLLLENDHVRVLEYTVAPGERDQWHTHPAKVSYVAEGGTVRVTTEDGKSFLADETAGTASWDQPVGRHFVQNVGRTPVRVILTEVKGAR